MTTQDQKKKWRDEGRGEVDAILRENGILESVTTRRGGRFDDARFEVWAFDAGVVVVHDYGFDMSEGVEQYLGFEVFLPASVSRRVDVTLAALRCFVARPTAATLLDAPSARVR